MPTLTTVVRSGRIKLDEPSDLPDGSTVEVTFRQASAESEASGPMPPDEIARILAAMQSLPIVDIPDDIASELDAWEDKVNQHGIDQRDPGMEKAFR